MSAHRQTISTADAKRPLFVGVDVGGTNTKIGVVDDGGCTLAFDSIATLQENGVEDAVQRIGDAATALLNSVSLAWNDVTAVGLATPGTMDIPAGMILEPPNMPCWRHFPIRDRLSEQIGKTVVFANDANAAAFGEWWVGTGQQFSSIVLLTLGTGVGGGIMLGELSIDGENSHGAECGHILIDYQDSARICSCGQRGHLEAYASATALVRRTEEALLSDQDSSLRARLDAGEELTTRMLAEEAQAGDVLSQQLIDETCVYLSAGILSLVHTIDPDAVVLGGAMNLGGHQTDVGRRFLQRIRDRVYARTFPAIAENLVVDYASLGGDAGYLGAAGLAREKVTA